MPKNFRIYRIFLASPSDVKEERDEVKKVIESYNQVHSSDNIKIELACWEDNTRPAFGDYPQDVVNSQIGDDYDIFIGILWARFGSPTPEYSSGTEEEFYRAYEKYSSGRNIEIMIYKKDESISPSLIMPDQLQKVNDFIAKVGTLGGYYFTFKTKGDFHDLLQKHLEQAIRDLEKKCTENSTPILPVPVPESDSTAIISERENWGVLEYNDYIVNTTSRIISDIDSISEMTEEIGERIQKYTNEFNLIRGNANNLHIRSFCMNVAKEMNRYAMGIKGPNDRWYSSFIELQDSIKSMLNISDGLVTADEWEKSLVSLRYTSSQMWAAYGAMRELYTAVNRLPKLMQQLNVAKIKVCNILKQVISNLKEGKKYCDETVEYIEDAIHPLSL